MSPSLIIYNPPAKVRRVLSEGKIAGLMSEQVHEIRYTHAEDGEPYRHGFEDQPGVQMFAVIAPDGSHGILILGSEGQSLWEEFQ